MAQTVDAKSALGLLRGRIEARREDAEKLAAAEGVEGALIEVAALDWVIGIIEEEVERINR